MMSEAGQNSHYTVLSIKSLDKLSTLNNSLSNYLYSGS